MPFPPAQVEAAPAALAGGTAGALRGQGPISASAPLRARYDWGYVGPDGEGRGTLDVLADRASGRLVLELHGLGERLVLLQGDGAQGYRLQIPRHKVDRTAPDLSGLELPFLPQLGSVEALVKLLRDGAAPGVTVTKRDPSGPVKLRFEGKDPEGKAVKVWLSRRRFEAGSDAPPAPRP